MPRLIVWRHRVPDYVNVTDLDAAVSVAFWSNENGECWPSHVVDDDGKTLASEEELIKLMAEYDKTVHGGK